MLAYYTRLSKGNYNVNKLRNKMNKYHLVITFVEKIKKGNNTYYTGNGVTYQDCFGDIEFIKQQINTALENFEIISLVLTEK
jgi:hypothetical protein